MYLLRYTPQAMRDMILYGRRSMMPRRAAIWLISILKTLQK